MRETRNLYYVWSLGAVGIDGKNRILRLSSGLKQDRKKVKLPMRHHLRPYESFRVRSLAGLDSMSKHLNLCYALYETNVNDPFP